MSDVQSKKSGRPTDYSTELVEEICDSIACASKGLRKLCEENEHWPARGTIFKWMKKYPEFRDQYAQAKTIQVESLTDDILELADNSENDTCYDEEGSARCNVEWINRCRLRIDTRKWLAAKLAPRIYGDKIHAEHSGAIGSAIDNIPIEKQEEAILDAADAIRAVIQLGSKSGSE